MASEITAFVESMIKHLPPSGSRLRLWDMGGRVLPVLEALRGDLDITALDTLPAAEEKQVDSIMALDYPAARSPSFLKGALRAMRPGGRLIMVDTKGEPTAEIVQQLEQHGHTRILVEPAQPGPPPVGVLMRGEKPHTTASTFARIRVAANTDDDHLSLPETDIPYVYLLVFQTPNKPVWALGPDETIAWEAVTLKTGNGPVMAGFTSLPKAVGLMQQAVMQGVLQGVNKVGKFRREVAETWVHPVLLNPTLTDLRASTIEMLVVDPATAEAPDE